MTRSPGLVNGCEPWTAVAIFCGVVAVAVSFALYTNHAWDDHYITYRPAKNLATGHGLVFNPGEKVQTFSSPLSVLTLAVLSKATGNTSDALVLWLFRVLSCVALGIAAVLLFRLARHHALTRLATVVLLGLFGTDAKIVDFSINGQEAGFMAFFLVLTLYALMVRSRAPATVLGIAWAGLLWTRPDGVVYFGVVALGVLVFDAADPAVANGRADLLKLFVRAGAITIVLYGPWFVWAWAYYGSPVPHTVIAKGLRFPGFGPRMLLRLVAFPISTLIHPTSLDLTFVPIYAEADDWSYAVLVYGRCLAWLCAFSWLVPTAPRRARAVSFAFMGAEFYLSYVAGPAPWYLPSCAVLGIVAFAWMVQHGLDTALALRDRGHRASRVAEVIRTIGGVVVAVGVFFSIAMAYELRVEQRLVEDGHRKQIGLWLREHAGSPKDTVFLEPLGYIGYFSQLRIHDFPGLASPEMVAARRRLNTDDWDTLIGALRPDWLVLRAVEARDIDRRNPSTLSRTYALVKTFDASREVESYAWLPGRNFLVGDQTFMIFKRR